MGGHNSDGEYNYIRDKGEIGFIDFQLGWYDDIGHYNQFDKGLAVSVPFPFKNGNPQSITVGETSYDSFTIKNTLDEPMDLWTSIYASNPEDSFTLSIMKPPSKDSDMNEIQGFRETLKLEDRMLEPGDSLTIWVSCKPKDIGLHTTAVIFNWWSGNDELIVHLLADDKISSSLTAKKVEDGNFLFTSLNSGKRKIKAEDFVRSSQALNAEQICSIKMILGCKGTPPYVIHGPPGTGKTRTLVEAIVQLFSTQRNARILVCCPSSSAVSHIIYKINSLSEAALANNERKLDIISICSFADELIDEWHLLTHCNLVVLTYMRAPLLNAKGVNRGHFTHIFLDDACQTSEPENMIAISNLCLSDTVVVLAGDPRQVGSDIYSRDADSLVLEKSYLERLFECDYYCEGDENYVTKLVKNYRCHPEILDLLSKLFYDGELVASKEDTDSVLASFNFLPNKEFPMVFYGILGCDEREDNHLSWFNRIEISKVIETIKRLTARDCVSKEDIGVITPYRQQVMKIKEVLDSLEMTGVEVGSVEHFQGQEKQVIIISMVRSTIKHKEFDRANCLGFLSNPRRFNIAITRAISLLVIIGNPHIICKDMNWNQLLWRCVDNKAYQGCNLPERQGKPTYFFKPGVSSPNPQGPFDYFNGP